MNTIDVGAAGRVLLEYLCEDLMPHHRERETVAISNAFRNTDFCFFFLQFSLVGQVLSSTFCLLPIFRLFLSSKAQVVRSAKKCAEEMNIEYISGLPQRILIIILITDRFFQIFRTHREFFSVLMRENREQENGREQVIKLRYFNAIMMGKKFFQYSRTP